MRSLDTGGVTILPLESRQDWAFDGIDSTSPKSSFHPASKTQSNGSSLPSVTPDIEATRSQDRSKCQ